MSFQRVCELSELEPETAYRAEVDGIRLTLACDADGQVHAVADECSHGNVTLSEGEVSGCQIECWLHGSRFDLRTGRPLSPPAVTPLAVYPVRIEDGAVLVAVSDPVPSES